MNSISDFTAEVEVVKVDTVPIAGGVETVKNDVTILLIKKVLSGKARSDTLFLLNDHGFECHQSVPYKEPGRQYIVSGRFADGNYIVGSRSTKNDLFILFLCSENILRLEGDIVIGNITKNRMSKRYKKSMRIKKISNKWYESYLQRKMYYGATEKTYQRMKKKKFYRKIWIRNLV